MTTGMESGGLGPQFVKLVEDVARISANQVNEQRAAAEHRQDVHNQLVEVRTDVKTALKTLDDLDTRLTKAEYGLNGNKGAKPLVEGEKVTFMREFLNSRAAVPTIIGVILLAALLIVAAGGPIIIAALQKAVTK